MGLSSFLRMCCTGLPALLTAPAFAQFEGGQGSGYDTLSFPNSICSTFSGSSYSGYAALHNPTGGNCAPFSGDSSSGYASLHQPGTGNCTLFIGGDFSGQQATHYSNPNSTCFLFTESVNGGSGHSTRAYSSDNPNPCAVIALGVDASPLSGEIAGTNSGRLFWQTYSERNNSGFEIQKGYDGLNWETIGWVNGAGNSNAVVEYAFVDPALSSEVQYYRFRQVDFDGTGSYSNIVALSLKAPASPEDIFVLFPNPASTADGLQLRGWVTKEWPVWLTVTDPAGRVLFSEHHLFDEGNELFAFPMHLFSAGAYYLSIQPDNNASPLRIPFVVH